MSRPPLPPASAARVLVVGLAAAVGLVAPPARAGTTKDRAISAYFAALDREDYTAARNQTTGQARDLTDHIVDELQRQSARRHVRVDIATRRVEIDAACDGPILVRFDIDLLGRFLFFRKKMKTIRGEATFSVDDSGRISHISGDLSI